MVDGEDAFLRQISSTGNNARLNVSSTATDPAGDPGPELTPAWELYARAITLTNTDTNESIVLKGPGHPDNSFSDDEEPYFWTPDNGSDFSAWSVAANNNAVSITMDDGATSGVTHAVNADPVTVAYAVPQPGITHQGRVAVDHTVNAGAVTVTYSPCPCRASHIRSGRLSPTQ